MFKRVFMALIASIGFVAAVPAVAATVLGDLGVTLEQGPRYVFQSFDITGDGFADIEAGINNRIDQGYIDGLVSYTIDPVQVGGGNYLTGYVSKTSLLFKNSNGTPVLWSAGDSVSDANAIRDNGAWMYGDYATPLPGDNLLPNIGDSGFYGFVTVSGNAVLNNCEKYCGHTFSGDTVVTYSFLKVTHGSLILGQYGYNSSGAAVIPQPSAVPLPASALLLVSAFAGFAATRRRKLV